MSRFPRIAAVAAILTLSACATRPVTAPVPAPVVTPAPLPVPAVATNALMAGVALAAPAAVASNQAVRALDAFKLSCPQLASGKRVDKSGLTVPADWVDVCGRAAGIPASQAAAFFRDEFAWVRIGEGKAFVTGYYEPEIPGSRTAAPGYGTPIYRTPTDLVRCTRPDGSTGRGRLEPATGECLPYYSRTEIEAGALAGKGLEIGYAARPVDLFFLQVQGSGRLRLPDGGVMRIGYAEQNGLAYVAIGKLLRDRNLLPPGGATMQGIVNWIEANPEAGAALMRENPSYVFFRELTGAGPLGAMNVPVTPLGSVAADPAFTPLGAPVFLVADRGEVSGLWVAQDTGGAIKGANRFDSFWGAGPEAERIAGGMSSNGTALLLIPKPAAARATAQR